MVAERRTTPEAKAMLKRILAQAGNERCADCKTSSHPRWASYNLGVLICIRCSGIHRSLGTHISKVRSIDLDFWTQDQLESLARIGNSKANAYWEAQLPPNYVPDESKIMNYVKTKYELKRWVAPGPPPGNEAVRSEAVDGDDIPLAKVKQAAHARRSEHQVGFNSTGAPQVPPRIRKSAASVDLLDIGGYNAPPRSSSTISSPATTSSLLDFADPTPAASAAATSSYKNSSHHHGHHHHNQQAKSHEVRHTTLAQPDRGELKKSILELYAKAQPKIETPSYPKQVEPASVGPSKESAVSSDLFGSLGSFDYSSNSKAPTAPQRAGKISPAHPVAGNVAAQTRVASTSTEDLALDDAVFANPWN